MLSRLSIRYKIGFIALIGFVGFVIFQAASYRMSVNIRDQLQKIRTDDFAILKFSNDIQVNFAELDKMYQASLAEADMDLLIEADAKARRMKLEFETVRQTYQIEDLLFHELYNLFNNYIDNTSSHTVAVLGNAVDYERTLEGYAQIGLLRERYEDAQSRFLEERYRAFENQLNSIEDEEANMVKFGLILGTILTMILGLFSILIIRNLINAFGNAVNVAEQIASGNLNQRIETIAQDETGQLMRSLHSMRDALKRQSEDNQQRESVQDFLSGLNETMRGDKSLDQLTHSILEYLCRHFFAQIGAFYLLEGNHLQMVAGYAYELKNAESKQFDLKGTLVGQVAAEKKPRIITDVPDDYVQIGSGIGQAMPRALMLVPILFEGGLKGLVEIAAFRRFSDEDLYLMRRCNDAIAISVNSAQSRLKVSMMLTQTQEQARELQDQRGKLAEINRTLEERTHELDRQNSELELSRVELLEKSKALELSGKYKSQFLSTMSHELRTPLNSILILSESLKDSDSSLAEEEVRHAEVIHTAGTELLSLINDILDLSKVEEGKMDILLEPVSTRELAESLRAGVDVIARNKGLAFNIQVADDVPEYIYTDTQRFKQIVRNFISNAIKFTAQGGVFVDFRLPVAADRFQNSPLTISNSLIITVRDTGIGIAPEIQSRVFNAFEQADGTTSRRHGGTGLGLTISKELAMLLGGEISLFSEGENKGSTFTLAVPTDARQHVDARTMPKPVDKPVVSRAPVICGESPHILVIEDNPVFHQVFTSVFAKKRFQLTLADTGQQAFGQMDLGSFDAIVVDLNLPDIQGVELLQQIRSRPGYRQTPVFVFTAQDMDDTLRSELLHYAEDIVTKSPTAISRIVDLIDGMRFKPAEAPSQTDGFSLEGVNVLLVDDDERNLYSISSALKRAGCVVRLAASGRQALEQLEQDDAIQIVLLDIMMPNMDGYEVMQRIGKTWPDRDLPIVALTAKAMMGDREKCLAAGASCYLSKPVDTRRLLGCIADCVTVDQPVAV